MFWLFRRQSFGRFSSQRRYMKNILVLYSVIKSCLSPYPTNLYCRTYYRWLLANAKIWIQIKDHLLSRFKKLLSPFLILPVYLSNWVCAWWVACSNIGEVATSTSGALLPRRLFINFVYLGFLRACKSS